ncbi:2-polyprenyl-3-methyl-6-methoxy-1,4-benzoquinone monooxygenase [Thiorhodococcus mannitoliphagus]|uniref:3-demethoxyubiquinol 3-hydroxylase n=1 Tax=Thiorhodococcus mannitoliphagus TaxID=329406 RepID=A0A6P1DSL7_9GAMM|nr:2-polyprenyl-3-methyl-6-methoxy-1,4-benzoquinone monooxygenase [Thiorhodococcus mannitoliphagus]NEX21287.1 2-polyprenyl-3-methyl-6-methoxy-1,4-benzoquinone monooxygenase [Thiorhodococcus mannitoliphagus]
MSTRRYSPLDRLLINADHAMRTLFGRPQTTARSNPASNLAETELRKDQRKHVARLMRINHTGEVCAQALYQGQALTAKLPDTRQRMEQSAEEENDHLAWCETRLEELGDHKSLLNPLWYAGSFAMGAAAGLAGDKWSLGFVVETERQVESHLDSHLEQIPAQDEKSRAILEQMKVDEIKHAQVAKSAGGADLPGPVRLAMKVTSRVMTRTVYWV